MPTSIAWREWSPAAFADASTAHKPVLLSLVTTWSEECAAMDETTYADQTVGALVAADFVAVRVDADRRPDLNERFNLGGWPTTAFLTGGGDILSGGTYFDAPSMIAVLRRVSSVYRDRRDEIGEAHSSGRREDVVAAEAGHDEQSSLLEFRRLLSRRFDPVHGGFDLAPKFPHPFALLFAFSQGARVGDDELTAMAGITLEGVSALRDPEHGGFHRYADHQDWSGSGSDKTLEDNAALLHVHVEAALRGHASARAGAAEIVQWVKRRMTDGIEGGFFNAETRRAIDRTVYIDRNAMMIGALIRAAALFDDVWLRDVALNAFERAIVPAYRPGQGVSHLSPPGRHPVAGLLTDQIHVAAAAIWAHAATGQLPYSMLAAEVLQHAVRTMWNDAGGAFQDRAEQDDPLVPFELNCHAACVLDRMASLTGDRAYHDRARGILRSLRPAFQRHELFGAAYALAVLEVIERQPPAGLELRPVDWGLG